MPDVSLTTFVDFISKAGTPKATVVRNCKHQRDYHPAQDYYRRLRTAIREMHEQGEPLAYLTNFIASLRDPKKHGHYNELARGYRSWARRFAFEWFDPGCQTWSHDGLDVRVNPELGLRINGVPHLVKLYFKAEPLAQNRVDLITHLMHIACQGGPHANVTKSVLAIRASRLFTPPVPMDGLTAQLRAEAAYWMALWPHV